MLQLVTVDTKTKLDIEWVRIKEVVIEASKVSLLDSPVSMNLCKV